MMTDDNNFSQGCPERRREVVVKSIPPLDLVVVSLTEKSDARSSQHVFPPHGPAPRSRRLVFGNRKALHHA